MASTTTTASSTSIPSEITVPSNTDTLSVKSVAYNTPKVPASENGMPMPTSNATFQPRNTQQTTVTNNKPCSALVCITLSALRVGTVWSSPMDRVSPSGVSRGLASSM